MSFSLKQIDDYIHALLTNAESLIDESNILFIHCAYSRAFTLSHIAREELSKCLMLHSVGVKILAGHPVDEKKLLSRLRDHKAKLNTENVQTSITIAALGSIEDAFKFLQSSSALTEHRNNRKNASLYVGFKNDIISNPSEQFSSTQASRNIALATEALSYQKKACTLMGKFSERSPITMPRIDPVDIHPEDMPKLLEDMANSLKSLIIPHEIP